MAALQEISDAISLVKQINSAMDETCSMQLIVFPEKGRSIKLPIPTEETKQVNAILARIRTKTIKEINSKASKFKIELDEEEKLIIADR